jgi:hypothetical protein
MAHFFNFFHTIPLLDFVKRDKLLSKNIKFKYESIKFKKKRMSSGSCLTSKLCDRIIKMPSKSHETNPLNIACKKGLNQHKFAFYLVANSSSICTVALIV